MLNTLGLWIPFAVVGTAIAIAWIMGQLISCCCVIVPQECNAISERMGQIHKIMKPGLHCRVPFVDKFRKFSWTKVSADSDNNTLIRIPTYDSIVDLREDVLLLPQMQVYTKDAIPVKVTVFLIISIDDVRRCIYEVDNLQSAIYNAVQAQVNELFSEYTFEECTLCQQALSELAVSRYSETFSQWGVRLRAIFVAEVIPDDSLLQSLATRMLTERQRRAELIKADASSDCTKCASEAQKAVLQYQGLGEQTRIKNISEGEALIDEIKTQAAADSLILLKKQLANEAQDYADFAISLKYIKGLWSGTGAKEISLSMDLDGMSGSFVELYK
ncbi:SPFH domain/Band 7 family protein [Spironucleus salmonicida]|uniref:SPFH domain/Band 7 family protein n=1 Tax=Spironucleus salmonicida TaxID=348837 RepID=V6LI28_9EUKA|nr:SPFH domain/Band 7 family protein [Spironucleus salmonicida]|eukprot:EST43366.1 SPFH domain/Band 7 family protein [Spironucleus salmonicida]